MQLKSPSALVRREVGALRSNARAAVLLQRDKAVSRLISAIWSAVPVGCTPSVQLLFGDGRPRFLISITLSGLSSFRAGLLPDLLEKLMDAGVDRWSSNDWPQFANRDYSGESPHVRVFVQAFLDTAAAECVRVKVGERTEPVYELRCG